mgnify:CR=1 FL=1
MSCSRDAVAGNPVLLWLAAFPLMSNPGAATLSLAVIGATFGARRGYSLKLFSSAVCLDRVAQQGPESRKLNQLGQKLSCTLLDEPLSGHDVSSGNWNLRYPPPDVLYNLPSARCVGTYKKTAVGNRVRVSG